MSRLSVREYRRWTTMVGSRMRGGKCTGRSLILVDWNWEEDREENSVEHCTAQTVNKKQSKEQVERSGIPALDHDGQEQDEERQMYREEPDPGGLELGGRLGRKQVHLQTGKRKRQSEEEQVPRKKDRYFQASVIAISSDAENEPFTKTPTPAESHQVPQGSSVKRKRESEEEQGPRKREKCSEASVVVISSDSENEPFTKTPTPAESRQVPQGSSVKRKREDCDDEHEAPDKKKLSSPDQSATDESWSKSNSRTAFQAKYKEEEKLGQGGFGSVAIKHVPEDEVSFAVTYDAGQILSVPLEVMLLKKVHPVPAVVKLLDCFEFNSQLVLVLERPEPCMDLSEFTECQGGIIEERDAKIITQQLVDALIEIHSQGVFHRDIKLENILVESGSSGPRVRIIDFGCGALLKDDGYEYGPGTMLYKCPQWCEGLTYRAEGATVWQVGVTVYRLLQGSFPFMSSASTVSDQPVISQSFSRDCRHFIHCSLDKDPSTRPTLQSLRQHPWLTETRTGVGTLIDFLDFYM
ncbi:uncharacterized protein V6R79_017888 [Siganus canaliculatus]